MKIQPRLRVVEAVLCFKSKIGVLFQKESGRWQSKTTDVQYSVCVFVEGYIYILFSLQREDVSGS